MGGHEIDDVLDPALSEGSLFGILRPDSFERDVDQSHQQQIEQKPIHAYGDAIEFSGIYFYACAAPGRGRDGEQHSRQCQSFFLAQKRRESAERNRGHDEELDQEAHGAQRIERAEFGGGEELRKMEAKNTAEREKSRKGGQDAAPPAGSEASGLGIAKERVNFLLEHDVEMLQRVYLR